MASIATSSRRPAPVGPHERETVGRRLQAALQDLTNLALSGKQLQWPVVGLLFRVANIQLAGFVDSRRDLADTVAERAVALGDVPDGDHDLV